MKVARLRGGMLTGQKRHILCAVKWQSTLATADVSGSGAFSMLQPYTVSETVVITA